MFSPISTMFQYFPLRAYSTVLILCAISWYSYKQLLIRWERGNLTKLQSGSRWLLVSYILLLLFLTVLGRRSMDYYRYNFEAGYSYRDAFYNGNSKMMVQIAVNIAMFIPVGILGTLGAKRFGFFKTLILGVMLTSGIELMQLFLRNGTCEMDDLISNVLGIITGCIMAGLYRLGTRLISKKNKSVVEA